MNKNRYLAIIPARKGSKRLPNKNILKFGGKPLIAWTIEAALKSKYINEVMVTTDSDEIAEISKIFGAKVPFIRPNELATDKASSYDVVKHAIDFYRQKDQIFDYIILLQPTSPLRDYDDIDKAIKLQIEKNANSVTSVCEMDHSPQWSNTLPNDNSMKGFINPEVIGKRSQDLETYYRLNGAIYIAKTGSFINDKAFISNSMSFAYKMDKKTSIDIDDKMDFYFAQFLLSIKNNN